jgi:DNA-binding XRE family transcriptional regulator
MRGRRTKSLLRKYLVEARFANGKLSQEAVANLADVKRQYYNSLESGGKGGKITLATAKSLCKALHMTLEEFYANEQAYLNKNSREIQARELLKQNMLYATSRLVTEND